LGEDKNMNLETIHAARERISPYLSMTPLLYSFLLERELKKHVWLKLETQLPTGSFKPRPAFNSILSHLDNAKKHGVIACSSGNFAQGVAYASHELGVNSMIVMTESTSPYKIERTRHWGADVVLCGDSHEDRIATTDRLQKETGRLLVHPYDSPETVAGDGVISLELSEQLSDKLNDMSVLVPVSGGGLIAGIAFTLKKLYPRCKIIGIQPELNGSIAKSFAAKKCVKTVTQKSIADALIAPIPGEYAFQFIREYVDDIVLVSEKELSTATDYFINQHKLVVEPGGAAPLAALFGNKISEKNIVCITSGGNIPLHINDRSPKK
jgi:threonine dehydratase